MLGRQTEKYFKLETQQVNMVCEEAMTYLNTLSIIEKVRHFRKVHQVGALLGTIMASKFDHIAHRGPETYLVPESMRDTASELLTQSALKENPGDELQYTVWQFDPCVTNIEQN